MHFRLLPLAPVVVMAVAAEASDSGVCQRIDATTCVDDTVGLTWLNARD